MQQETMQRLQSDFLQHDGLPDISLAMSRSLWSSANPGYVFRNSGEMKSVAKTDFMWDPEEVWHSQVLLPLSPGLNVG